MVANESEKDTIVPTSGMSFENQVLILRAYVILSEKGLKPIHYRKVMSATRLARTQISGVNEFFIGLGLLKRVEIGTYLPSEELVQFYSKDVGNEDYEKLRKPIRDSTLFRSVKGFILIHGFATENEIIDYLLEESGETTKSRAKRSLEWLERTQLIEIADNNEVILLEKTSI